MSDDALHLHRTGETPPGGWQYVQKETGVKFHSNVYSDLFASIYAHRKAMGLDIPSDWRVEVDQEICKKVPRGWCVGGPPLASPDPSGKIGFREALSGTATLVDFFMHGSKRVDRGTAESRAVICVTCPKNVPLAECSSCNSQEIRDIITKVVEGGKTSVDDQLHVCAVCSCSNQAAVWIPLSVLQPHISEEVNKRLPDFCWKKKADKVEEAPAETPKTVKATKKFAIKKKQGAVAEDKE